jgi:hypothetical protein
MEYKDRDIVHVPQPDIPEDGWFTDACWNIMAGGNEELEAQLKSL